MPSVHEQLSGQFYKWESRGRGWQVFGEPVCPEPPFQYFSGYRLPEASVVDDGRKPTFLSSLFRTISQPPPPAVIEEVEEDPEPIPLVRDSLVEFQASLPADLDLAKESFDQFFHNLALCREPIAFELLGTHKRVLAQFAASAADASRVRRQLSAHFPDVQFRQLEGALEKAWEASEGEEALAVEFGLEREFMLPLATGKIDPFVGLVGALAELQPGELALFQILWQPVQNAWAESIINSVTLPDGKPLFVNASELAGAAEAKAAKPLHAVVVRIMARVSNRARLEEIARDMASSLRVFSNPQGNALIPLDNEDYPFEEHLDDVLRRQSRRSGMILNSDELTGFVHLPSSAVRSPALQRDSGRTKAAPGIVQKASDFVIGDNEHNGAIIPVFLTAEQRVRHTHIIGQNGTGKSSLLLNLIRQDIENGDGLAVLDPHGDLIDQILDLIPAERINDVVLVDPSDVEFPIGFNILQAHSEEEKTLLASDLVSVFRRLSTSWGDQMDAVLQNAILVILESSRGGTLADLRRFLLEPPFRAEFLQTVQDPELIYYWQKVFPQLGGGKSIGSVLTRLQDFFSQKRIRNMVSQRENKLDFADIMDSGKIFLAKLSEGLGGEENSYLLGTLLVSKFQQLVMARQKQKVEARRNFWLYIDEFQHFISPSMAKILTGARKYRFGFTLSHQHLHQLQSDAKVASAVMTEPCTRIVLRVGDDDAKKLGECFDSFDAKSLTRLEQFHAIVRVERNDFDFNLALRKPEPNDSGNERTGAIIAASRARYATPRAEVEAMLLANLRPAVSKPKPPESPGSDEPTSPQPKPVAEAPKTAEVPKPVAPLIISETKQVVVPEILTPKVEPPAVKRESPRDLGRGGAQHQAIQKRIKAEAEELGFRSMIEKSVLDGQGSVDLWLERPGQAIACEISISTTIDHEFKNIAKCLKTDVQKVAVICLDEERLRKIEAAVSGSLGVELAARVGYFLPDTFIASLKNLPLANPKTPEAPEVRRGYRIKRQVVSMSQQEQRQRDDEVVRAMAEAMQNKKK